MAQLTYGKPVVSAKASAARTIFRPDIQGLRAFAVLSVIASHLFTWPQGGFVGVDVFFVISGFLITSLLLREYDRTGSISFMGFYKRRAKRILPASFVVLLVTASAAFVILSKTRAVSIFEDAVWAGVFSGNWRFAIGGTDYFQESLPPSPLQHFWSLGVEEQFYFVWPWLMVLIFWAVSRRAGGARHGRRLIGLAIVVLMGSSFVWALVETDANPTWAYFSTFSRAWELGAGALIAVVAPILTRIPKVLRPIFAWLGIGGLITCVFAVQESPGFPAPNAAFPVVATMLVIAAGTSGPARFLWPLTSRIAGYIGDVSFSLYLWHWPVIILLVAFMPAGSVGYYITALIATGALSLASYHWVENPARNFEWPDLRPSRRNRKGSATSDGVKYLALGCLAILTFAVVAFALVKSTTPVNSQLPNSSLSRSQGAASSLAPAEPSSSGNRCFGAAAMEKDAKCDPGGLGGLIAPQIDNFASDAGDGFTCWRAQGKVRTDCTIGSTKPDARKIALVGDSHAASLIPALGDFLVEKNWSMDVFVGYGCQWMEMSPGADCYVAMQEIQEKLRTPGKYVAVLTTAARSKVGPDTDKIAGMMANAWEDSTANGGRVVVIADVPDVSQEALDCIQRVGFDVQKHQCGTSRALALGEADPLAKAAAMVEGTKVLDLTSFFCAGESCPSVIGNAIVYRDTDAHLTSTFAKTLSPYVTSGLVSALE